MAFAECMYVGSEAEAIAEKYGKLICISTQDLDTIQKKNFLLDLTKFSFTRWKRSSRSREILRIRLLRLRQNQQ